MMMQMVRREGLKIKKERKNCVIGRYRLTYMYDMDGKYLRKNESDLL